MCTINIHIHYTLHIRIHYTLHIRILYTLYTTYTYTLYTTYIIGNVEDSYNHYLHHKNFNNNYGSSPLWDHIMGTTDTTMQCKKGVQGVANPNPPSTPSKSTAATPTKSSDRMMTRSATKQGRKN